MRPSHLLILPMYTIFPAAAGAAMASLAINEEDEDMQIDDQDNGPDPVARAATAYRSLTLEVAPPGEVLLAEVDAETGETTEWPAAARWEGIIGFEEQTTGDGRRIAADALRWADDLAENPAQIRYVREDVGAHDNAVVVAGMDTIERREGGVIWGSGPFYLDNEDGRMAYKAVKLKQQNGISMDLDDVSFEIQVASDLLGDDDGFLGLLADGGTATANDSDREHETIMEINSDDEIMLTTSARVRAATIVGIPAFADARISVVDLEEEEAETDDDATPAGSDELALEQAPVSLHTERALVAAGIPIDPPAAWFDDPQLTEPTRLQVTDDGRVYGHIAVWGTCHASFPHGASECVGPPTSDVNYAHFHTGELRTADGTIIDVGRLTMDTGHAPDHYSGSQAQAHYDNTGTAAADVRAGQDGIGIWVAGALRPGMGPAKRRVLRSSPISGDWRRKAGNLELHAALAVNKPGYAVPRPHGLVASGQVRTLVAAGMLPPTSVLRPGTEGATLTADDINYLRGLAERERTRERETLASRVRASADAMKVRAFVAARKNTSKGTR